MPAANYQIVVGFDGLEGAKKALTWAADEARLRKASLRIVRAWTPGEFGTNEESAQITAKSLDQDVHSLLGDNPGFDTDLVTSEGRASRVLIDQSEGAAMLVVGSRGHGGFAGLLLGSVGQQLTAHAGAAAVVIIR